MEDKKFINDVMSDAELDNVAGGTVAEVNEMYTALENKFGPFTDPPADINAKVNFVENMLREKFNILAQQSIGYGGSGWGEINNEYFDRKKGKNVTHQDVLNMIKKYR